MPAGEVTVRLNLNKDGYSAGMTAARRQAAQLGGSLKDVGSHAASSMQAASASIRLLEGGMTGNIRAAERFISTIPGVGKALQAAFPVVGGIALAGVFVRIGEEAVKAIQKIQQAPQVISNSFREMNLSAETSIDMLNLSTAKMQEQIALLSGKRPNALAEDLAEASIAADKLATSLDNDNRKIAEMLKANGLSALSGLIGKAGTAEVGGSVNYFDQQMADLAARHQHAVRTGDTAGAADLQKQLDDKRIAALNYANSQIGQRQQGQGPGSLNQDANLAVLTGFRNTLVDQQDLEKAEANNKAAAAQQKKLEDARKYAAELLKVYEDQEKQQNAFSKLTTDEEIQFWSNRIAAFAKGGQQYLAVQDKIYDLIAKRPDLFSENKKNQAEAGKSTVEGNDLLGNAQKALITGPAIEQIERAAKSLEKYNEMVAQSAALKTKETQAFQESAIAIALEQGSISRLAAAQALAKVHADEHAAALRDVNKALADQISLINDPSTKMSADDRANALRNAKQEAGNQTDQINSVYAVTQQQDASNIYRNTSSGEAADTYRTMMQSWANMTESIAQAMTKAADSFNSDIAAAITGHGKKGDFGKTFSTLGESLVKASLQKGESALFGGGQLGASANNPVWTRSANGAAGGALGSQSPFFRPFIGGQQGQGNGQGQSGGGSIWGQLFHSFLPGLFRGQGNQSSSGGDSDGGDSAGGDGAFQGFFAGGGDVLANHPALVGEHGPELFTPRSAGRITPNSALGGGGDTHVYHIDARGATDPAAVHAAVARALPHAVAASVQAVHAQAKRSPSGR